MKALRFNADYESVLFKNKESLSVNQALEFLALFLNEGPLFSHKKYSSEYLDHVSQTTQAPVKIVSSGPFENWWGKLSNLELERKLNSKELSATLDSDSVLTSNLSELNLEAHKKYLAKDPFGMSGMGMTIFDLDHLPTIKGSVIVEPLFERDKDFSHYVFEDDSRICYENIVDQKFQYKGTLFSNLNDPSLKSLSFYHEVKSWDKFQNELERIIHSYRAEGATDGFSVDSFTYEKNRVRTLSEVNYRKTMGLLAWKLSKVLAKENTWSLFLLGKGLNQFSRTKEISQKISGCTLLSPGDTRFEMFLLTAPDAEMGKRNLEELKRLLPDCQFAIEV